QLVEEADARTDVVERAAVRESGGEDARDGRVRRQWIAVQRDLVPVRRLEEILERLRRRLDDVRVVADRDRAPVVAVPAGPRILHPSWDRLVLRDLVGLVQALVRTGDRERRSDVDHIGRTRVALERADRLVFLGGAAVRIVLG